jgi:hypothetical protein
MQQGMEAKLVNQMKHIEALLEELSQDELLALIESIARRLRRDGAGAEHGGARC